MRRADGVALVAILILAAPRVVAAQQPPAEPSPPAATDSTLAPGEVRLVYDREVFSYASTGRRDPFAPLIGPEQDGLGPRFEELTLRGIIYSPVASKSVVLLGDPKGKIFRARQGEIVGNARVLSIQPLRALFQVESFGVNRQEMLELKGSELRGGRR